jgi:hypothetical protein
MLGPPKHNEKRQVKSRGTKVPWAKGNVWRGCSKLGIPHLCPQAESHRQIEEMVPDSLSQAEERVSAFRIVVRDILDETPQVSD